MNSGATPDDRLLDVRDLNITFETDEGTVRAADGVSFHVNEGEIFGIVGESGSGKTATALSLLGLIDPPGKVTADAIEYKNEDLRTYTETELETIRGEEISIIFQDALNSLNPVITVGEQIAEVVRKHTDVGESTAFLSEVRRKFVTGTSTESRSWQRAVELLEMVGIPDPAKRAEEFPHQLSGGMRQRVMIAQALASEPSLIIADEPTTALDVIIEDQILDRLVELKDEFGVSIIFITHDLGVVRQTCDRLAVMYAGEIMEKGPAEAVFTDPRHPYTRGLIDTVPRRTDDRERLGVIDGSIPDLVDKPAGCPFAPRCSERFDLCSTPLEEYPVDEGHSVSCHLYRGDRGAEER